MKARNVALEIEPSICTLTVQRGAQIGCYAERQVKGLWQLSEIVEVSEQDSGQNYMVLF